jgi:excisionase family DNA binding protein
VTDGPLSDASRRLRRPAGRPKRLSSTSQTGARVQGSTTEPADSAPSPAVFAASLPPRGLPLPLAESYSGLPERALWRAIAAGTLPTVRVPGVRHVLILKDDLDAYLERHRVERPS